MANITITAQSQDFQTFNTPKVRSVNTNNIRYATAQPLIVKFAITSYTSTTVVVTGNHLGAFPAASIFTIFGSTGNDGSYTVVSSAFNGTNTVVTVASVPVPAGTGGTVSATVTGAKVQVYNPYGAKITEYKIFEPIGELILNDANLQSFTVVSMDGLTVNKTATLNAASVISSNLTGVAGQTDLTYDFGFQNHAKARRVVIVGTIEAIDKAAGANIKYAVSVVDQTNKVFAIAGDHTALFLNTVSLVVAGSTGNNGTYTVSGNSVYGGAFTYITVVQAIPSAVADGFITV